MTKTKAPMENGTIILRRTFNQTLPDGSSIRFWRVIGPQTCPSLNSDLSLEGLKEWGLIR